jgi:predicted transposase/invertase (TIGR01784 family)
MGRHDRSYKAFFAHRRMIQDLLRDIVGERWVDLIDLDSGEQVSPSFWTQRKHRESDIIWKFRRKDDGAPVYVYIMLEFQSRPDPSMPVRFMNYVSSFYLQLMAGKPASEWRNLPLVIPVLIYNGLGPWRGPTSLGSMIGTLDPSAEIYRPQLRYRLIDESSYSREELAALSNPVAELFRIERSHDWSEIRASVHRLRRTIPPTEDSLRRVFEAWLKEVIVPRLGLPEEAVTETSTLEEFETMLAESIDRWNRELREEGRQEGRQEGEALMLLQLIRLKFGPLAPEVEKRVRSADADRLLEWGKRVLSADRLEDVFKD